MKKTIAIVLMTLAAPAHAWAPCSDAQDYTTCKQLEEINQHLEKAERQKDEAEAERLEWQRADPAGYEAAMRTRGTMTEVKQLTEKLFRYRQGQFSEK